MFVDVNVKSAVGTSSPEPSAESSDFPEYCHTWSHSNVNVLIPKKFHFLSQCVSGKVKAVVLSLCGRNFLQSGLPDLHSDINRKVREAYSFSHCVVLYPPFWLTAR